MHKIWTKQMTNYIEDISFYFQRPLDGAIVHGNGSDFYLQIT